MAYGGHTGLSDRTLLARAIAPQSVTTGAIAGAATDMQGWDGVRFEISIGAMTGAGTLDGFVDQSTALAMTNAANISGASLTQVTNANANTVAVIEVWKPTMRYLRLNLTQAANTVIFGATSTRYRRGGSLPPTQSAQQVVRVAVG